MTVHVNILMIVVSFGFGVMVGLFFGFKLGFDDAWGEMASGKDRRKGDRRKAGRP